MNQLSLLSLPLSPLSSSSLPPPARSCAPKVDVNASPGYLSVQMDFNRSDHSLQNEYGGHLSYTLLYGREGEKMKVTHTHTHTHWRTVGR